MTRAPGLMLGSRHEFMDRGQAEALAPMVQETMVLAGVAFKDLARIAVTTGPGTFTGVRIGLAMARGLGVALNIPITGINSLAAIACNETAGDLPIVVAVDARANEIYFATYDQSGHELTAPAIVTLADAHKFMPSSSGEIAWEQRRTCCCINWMASSICAAMPETCRLRQIL